MAPIAPVQMETVAIMLLAATPCPGAPAALLALSSLALPRPGRAPPSMQSNSTRSYVG
jgi:hypothetical protein